MCRKENASAAAEWRQVYLRHTTRWKDGKAHTYWRVVRSVRHGSKVEQVTVAHLGELDEQGRANARALARHITGRDGAEQGSLFEPWPPKSETVTVRLDQVRVENGLAFGAVWLGWRLWEALGLDRLCEELLPAGRESVPWSALAAVLVIGRLCEPSSELHVAEDWYRRTALADLVGIRPEHIYDERLYRTLDRLLPHKEAIEKHLVKRLGELFAVHYDLLLYDVTSTYFEGQCAAPTLARRGHSRDHRPDCLQVNIALVVTRQGIPLGHEIFAGNTADVDTVETIVETMERRYGKADRVWVMDRGMVSQERIEWLQETGRRYVIGTPRSELRKWSGEFQDRRGWQEIRTGVEVKICAGPSGQEVFLLCRSEDRAAKEKAMHQRFSLRIEQGLQSLGRRIEKSTRLLDKGVLERQIGRLLQRNSRAAARYHIELIADPAQAAGVRLHWQVNAPWDQWAEYSEGSYILRTNITDWTPESLWATYIQLTDAEAAFRTHKSDLSIRPIWHRKERRIRAHIFVCFLAYVLWKTLEQWQARAGLGNSPRTILEELGHIQSTDVVLPLADGSDRELRLRCVVRPDKAQAALIDRLGLELPQRLRPPAAASKM
jgi:transposase